MKKTLKIHSNILTVLLLIALAALPGCAFFESKPEPSDPKTSQTGVDLPSEASSTGPQATTVPTQTQDALRSSPQENVLEQGPLELLWAIPEQPVDGYLINYGRAADTLDQEVFVETTQLQTVQHPSFGNVYRYVVPRAPSTGPLFVSISAYRGNRLSERGEVRRVESAQ